MITKTRQNWTTGETVKVGFMNLAVVCAKPTPGDFAPDAYLLRGLGDKAARRYVFVPHHGAHRLRDNMTADEFLNEI